MRVEADAGAFSGIPRVAALASPLSAPTPTLSAALFAHGGFRAFVLPDGARAAAAAPAPLPAASAVEAAAPASPAETLEGAGALDKTGLPVSGFREEPTTVERTGLVARLERVLKRQSDVPNPQQLESLYDDDSPAGRLGLDDLSIKGGKWRTGGRVLSRAGQGSIGFVDVHPTRPGLVVKTIDPSLDQLLGGLTVDEAIKHDDHSAAVLADAGVGPRVLGRTTIDGRRLSVRERIFGKTMRDLITDHAFGAEEEALVLDIVARMAAKNILETDLKPENIMLGTTERDGVRRAWFVDGGVVEAFAPGLDDAARVQKLLDYPNVIGMRMDYNTRSVHETVRTLRSFLSQGREESAMSPRRLFLKKLASSIFMSGLAAANK